MIIHNIIISFVQDIITNAFSISKQSKLQNQNVEQIPFFQNMILDKNHMVRGHFQSTNIRVDSQLNGSNLDEWMTFAAPASLALQLSRTFLFPSTAEPNHFCFRFLCVVLFVKVTISSLREGRGMLIWGGGESFLHRA